MSIEVKPTARTSRERGRQVYRLTADQVLRMVECGILPEGGPIELWDGVLYTMTKGEIHNYVVSEVADLLRPVVAKGYHLREEKTCKYGDHSLPEPDVAVARGRKSDYLPDPPPLSALALVVEVSQSSTRSDTGRRLRRYAEVGIPVYWVVDVQKRTMSVHTRPQGKGKEALYATVETYLPGQHFSVVIDGPDVGRLNVSDLFPPEPKPST
jgi:Uma2 family endonuclease